MDCQVFKISPQAQFSWQHLPPNLRKIYPTPIEAWKAGLLEGISSPLESFPVYLKTGRDECVFDIEPGTSDWYPRLVNEVAQVLGVPGVEIYYNDHRLDEFGISNVYRMHARTLFSLSILNTPLALPAQVVSRAADTVVDVTEKSVVAGVSVPVNLWTQFVGRLHTQLAPLFEDNLNRLDHLALLTSPSYSKPMITDIVNDPAFIVAETGKTFAQSLVDIGFVFPGRFVDAVAQSVATTATRAQAVFTNANSGDRVKDFFSQNISEVFNFGGWMTAIKHEYENFKHQFFGIDASIKNSRSRPRSVVRYRAATSTRTTGKQVLYVGVKYHQNIEEILQRQNIGTRLLTYNNETDKFQKAPKRLPPGATVSFELGRLNTKANKLKKLLPFTVIAVFANQAHNKPDINKCAYVSFVERNEANEQIVNNYWTVPDYADIASWTVAIWFSARDPRSNTRIFFGKFGRNGSSIDSADWKHVIYVDNARSLQEVANRKKDPYRTAPCWHNIKDSDTHKALLPLPSGVTAETAVTEIMQRIDAINLEYERICGATPSAKFFGNEDEDFVASKRGSSASSSSRSKKSSHSHKSTVPIPRPGVQDPHNGSPGVKWGLPPAGRVGDPMRRPKPVLNLGVTGDAIIDIDRLMQDIISVYEECKNYLSEENLLKTVQMIETYKDVLIWQAFWMDHKDRRRISLDYTERGLQLIGDDIAYDRTGVFFLFELTNDLHFTYKRILEDPEEKLLPALIFAHDDEELPLISFEKLTPLSVWKSGHRKPSSIPQFGGNTDDLITLPPFPDLSKLASSLWSGGKQVVQGTEKALSAVEEVVEEAGKALKDDVLLPAVHSTEHLLQAATSKVPVVNAVVDQAVKATDEVEKTTSSLADLLLEEETTKSSPIGMNRNPMERQVLSAAKIVSLFPEIAAQFKFAEKPEDETLTILQLFATYPDIKLFGYYSKYENISELQRLEYPDLQLVEGTKDRLGYNSEGVFFFYTKKWDLSQLNEVYAMFLKDPSVLQTALEGAAGEQRPLVDRVTIAKKSLTGDLFTRAQQSGLVRSKLVGVTIHPDGNPEEAFQFKLENQEANVGDLYKKFKHRFKHLRHHGKKLKPHHHHVKISDLLKAEPDPSSGYVTLTADSLTPIGAKPDAQTEAGFNITWSHNGKNKTIAKVNMGWKIGHIRELIARELGVAAAKVNLILSDLNLVPKDTKLVKKYLRPGSDTLKFSVKTIASISPLASSSHHHHKQEKTYSKVDAFMKMSFDKGFLTKQLKGMERDAFVLIAPDDESYEAKKIERGGPFTTKQYLTSYLYRWMNPKSRESTSLEPVFSSSTGKKKKHKTLKFDSDSVEISGKGKGQLVPLRVGGGFKIFKFTRQ
jgi:hypothetical protein